MTDITLAQPAGEFLFEGRINGDICHCDIAWDCQYDNLDPVFVPPIIRTHKDRLLVVAPLGSGLCAPGVGFISPGVLTLTPTATCETEDPDNPEITVLDPIYLVIGAGDCYYEDKICPVPINGDFEYGDTTGWVENTGTIVTSPVFEGTYAFQSDPVAGITLRQDYIAPDLELLEDVSITLSVQAYASALSSIVRMEMVWYENPGDTVPVGNVVHDLTIPPDRWSLLAVTGTVPAGTGKLQMYFFTSDTNVTLDKVQLTPCI